MRSNEYNEPCPCACLLCSSASHHDAGVGNAADWARSKKLLTQRHSRNFKKCFSNMFQIFWTDWILTLWVLVNSFTSGFCWRPFRLLALAGLLLIFFDTACFTGLQTSWAKHSPVPRKHKWGQLGSRPASAITWRAAAIAIVAIWPGPEQLLNWPRAISLSQLWISNESTLNYCFTQGMPCFPFQASWKLQLFCSQQPKKDLRHGSLRCRPMIRPKISCRTSVFTCVFENLSSSYVLSPVYTLSSNGDPRPLLLNHETGIGNFARCGSAALPNAALLTQSSQCVFSWMSSRSSRVAETRWPWCATALLWHNRGQNPKKLDLDHWSPVILHFKRRCY